MRNDRVSVSVASKDLRKKKKRNFNTDIRNMLANVNILTYTTYVN